MKFKRTRKFFSACLSGFLAQTDSPGTPERAPWDDTVMKLEAASEALRQIECLDYSLEYSQSTKLAKIHKIAQTSYRATQ